MVSESAVSNADLPTQPRLGWMGVESRAAAWWLLRAFAFSIPFSIFVSQLLLVLTAVAAALDWRGGGVPRPRTPLDLPIACFALTALLAAAVGLDTRASLWGLRSYLQIVIVYLVYAYGSTPERASTLVGCFLAGSAVTAAYTLLGAAAPSVFSRLFLGQMTQSGQLLFAIGLILPRLLRGGESGRRLPLALLVYVLALIVNLKRGVWLGVAATVGTVALLISRRLVLIAAVVIVVTAAAVSPVRARIANSTRDLFLPGNRHDIWLAAIDVVQRFPMGVGRKNGGILRDYPNIPQHHKHAHNNLLQVTLEHGFLGLAVFLWWMARFARLAWRSCQRVPPHDTILHPVAVAVFATFIGFHVAGLVEYNFGDSEVLEAFFLTMGLGLVVDASTRRGE